MFRRGSRVRCSRLRARAALRLRFVGEQPRSRAVVGGPADRTPRRRGAGCPVVGHPWALARRGTLKIDRVFTADQFRNTTKTKRGRDVPVIAPLAHGLVEWHRESTPGRENDLVRSSRVGTSSNLHNWHARMFTPATERAGVGRGVYGEDDVHLLADPRRALAGDGRRARRTSSGSTMPGSLSGPRRPARSTSRVPSARLVARSRMTVFAPCSHDTISSSCGAMRKARKSPLMRAHFALIKLLGLDSNQQPFDQLGRETAGSGGELRLRTSRAFPCATSRRFPHVHNLVDARWTHETLPGVLRKRSPGALPVQALALALGPLAKRAFSGVRLRNRPGHPPR